MKSAGLIFCLILFYTATVFGQVYKAQIDSVILPSISGGHYQAEFNLDAPLDASKWEKVQKGMHVAFGTSDEKYFRTEVPDINENSASWEATGWKGERLNAQIVFWSVDTLNQLHLTLHDLLGDNGKLLSKSNIEPNLVYYVLSNYPYNSKGFDCGPSPYKNGYLMPDRFDSLRASDRFDLPAKTVRQVWLSCNIPSNAEPGIYSGNVDVESGRERKTLKIQIRVQDQLLPKPHDWKYRLDLWQNPWVIAEYYHVKPWSEEHKALLKKHLRLYADAGGTYITTYGVHSPWAGNEYVVEGGMIEWIKEKDNTWKFDYTIFDQYVELAMSMGIDKAITIYTPVPWGYRFRYLTENTGQYEYASWSPTSEEFKSVWRAFLDDLKIHLEKKGWFDKTYLGINENPMDQVLAAIKVIKAHSNKWKITYAGNWHPELDSLLDDYCFLYSKEASVRDTKARAAKGFTTTYYVCCNPDKPNNFVFSPPVEGRWISWYSMAHGYSGFLRWAYDAWPADPVRDARYGSWAAGDCYLVYPGGNSSIRFEKLREGIVDYEKIRILKEKAAKSTDKNVQNLMQQLNQHLETLVTEKEFNTEKITRDVEKGTKLVEELSDRLAQADAGSRFAKE
ncbi:MAG: hypothetical protein C5B59_19735 [Bacteroidetes bacterium]|nr:MAG: hypothetical protein C5B59_19735 [Bacteroidota bacterium]